MTSHYMTPMSKSMLYLVEWLKKPSLNLDIQVRERFVTINIKNKKWRDFARNVNAELGIGNSKTGWRFITVFKKMYIFSGDEARFHERVTIELAYDQDKKELSVLNILRLRPSGFASDLTDIKLQDITLPCLVTLTLHGDNLRDKDRMTRYFHLWADNQGLRFGEDSPHPPLSLEVPES